MNHTFQVDLRGVVDLLSHHLYASPRVYVRELLQNAVDALTARRATDPAAPAVIRVETAESAGDGALRISDTGIGLTEPQVHELLATIGRSSKRDELGFVRHDFLGQFGIGLLSCFLVADEIRVETRSAAPGAATVRWTGYSDGRYDVAPAPEPRAEVGTTVTLVPRRESEHWLAGRTVTELARLYGSLLPFSVTVDGTEITVGSPPWLAGTPAADRPGLPVDPGTTPAGGPGGAPNHPNGGSGSDGAQDGPGTPGGPGTAGAAEGAGPGGTNGGAGATGTNGGTASGEPGAAGFPGAGGFPAPGRRAALIQYAREVFGFTPFDVVDLRVADAGLTGVAFVLPTPANPAARAGHRVYLKRMLLAEGAEDLLPNWAFFARCVIDTTELRPTASREALYEDQLLSATREALGEQLRGWLVRLATRDPRRLVSFLNVHHLGVKALALHDDEMLRLVEQWWPMETNAGRMTLAEFRARYGLVRYTTQHDEFRQIAAVAAAQELPLVNAGFAYDTEIIERIPMVESGAMIERLEPSDLTTRFHSLEPGVELALRPFLSTAQRVVDRLGCEVVLRAFDPAGLPALYLVNRSAAFAAEARATRERVDEIWADVLDALSSSVEDDRPQLVLNYRNPLVRRITELGDEALAGLAVESLYGQALLLGHHPIRPADAALLNSSFLGLLNRAVPERRQRP